MKRRILFEKLSKRNEIERQKVNRDNCSKTKRRNERKIQYSKKSTKQTKHQSESTKLKKKQHHTILKSKISRNQTQNFVSFF